MNTDEKVLLAKMDSKLDNIGKKLDSHLSEHFKVRLAIFAFIGTLVVGLVMAI
jgi:hypothetical protein